MEHIYLQVSSGRGPLECCRVVAKLLPVIMKEAAAHQLEAFVMEKTNAEVNGTLQSVLVRLSGNNAASFATGWEGTVQWIARSPFRKMHKRKNWFVSIQCFYPGTRQIISMKEVAYTTCRASGPGGQHVNKTETAVRATHRPSGLSVVASGSRSQHQNRKEATERLLEKLTVWEAEQQLQQAQEQWLQHSVTERGNAVRIFRDKL